MRFEIFNANANSDARDNSCLAVLLKAHQSSDPARVRLRHIFLFATLLEMGSGDLPDYRSLLKSEFLARSRKVPTYRLADFARSIGTSLPFTSQLLAGKTHLSPLRARSVVSLLGWPQAKRKRFLNLVEAAAARYGPHREAAMARLDRAEVPRLLSPAMLEELGWQHFALLEILKAASLTQAIHEFARRMNWSEARLEEKLMCLERHGLARRRGKDWLVSHRHHRIASPFTDQMLQNLHRDLMCAALDCLANEPADKRQFDSLLLAFDPVKIDEARKAIFDFVKTFNARFSSPKPQAVYGLTTQFFRIDRSSP